MAVPEIAYNLAVQKKQPLVFWQYSRKAFHLSFTSAREIVFHSVRKKVACLQYQRNSTINLYFGSAGELAC